MAFDLSSAQPVTTSTATGALGAAAKPKGFDLSTAKPVGPDETYSQRVARTGAAFDQAVGAPKDEWSVENLKSIGRTAVAALEDATAMGSGIAGDVAGAATSIATQNPKRGEAVRRAMTYEPRTAGGKAGQEYLAALTAPVGKAVAFVPAALERSGHPIIAQAARAGIDVALGRGGKIGDAARETGESAAKSAIDEGYTIKPSNAGGKVGRVVEGYTNSARLGREAAIKNQPITNRIAKQDIGLKPNQVITPMALKAAKAPHNAVYEEVGEKLGEVPTDGAFKAEIEQIGRSPGNSFPGARSPAIDQLKAAYSVDRFNAADGIQETRKLRAAARKNIKAPNDPEKNELGHAQLAVSDALERQMERYGEKLSTSEEASAPGGMRVTKTLMQRFRSARQALAKIHSVENALVGSTGDVSAPALAKQLARGAPLSGKLKLVADTATKFPEEMRVPEKLRDKTPTSAFEGYGAYGVGGIGGYLLHDPHLAVLSGAGLLAKPAARAILRSRPYQEALARGNTLSSVDLSPATRSTLAAEEGGNQ